MIHFWKLCSKIPAKRKWKGRFSAKKVPGEAESRNFKSLWNPHEERRKAQYTGATKVVRLGFSTTLIIFSAFVHFSLASGKD
jgi:hypothetical protein